MIQMKGVNAGARSLADNEVDAKILHRRVQNFFDGGLEAMNFVEEENFAQFERGENGGEIAFAFEERASAGLDGNVEFVGDDFCERGFSQSRRAIEEKM